MIGACSDNRESPNFIIVYTDDQRFDALGANDNTNILTPSLDSLSRSGINFKNAFVTLSICSPSRAALLTGRYGSANGVTTYNKNPTINDDERTIPDYFNDVGYQTAMVGKWHLENSPKDIGFDFYSYFISNGSWYNRKVFEQGEEKTASGFIEDYNAAQAIEFLKNRNNHEPFVLFLNPQLPHLDHNHEWDARKETIKKYENINLDPPQDWKDDLSGKPPYLKTGRHRQLAVDYGYRDRDTLANLTKRYYAAITDMDTALGRVFQYVDQEGLDENTYIFVLSDNGWFIGDHMFTSKVLAYEESIRVPFFVNGPNIEPGTNEHMVLNIDILPTLMELADIEIPNKIHGRSLLPLLQHEEKIQWRDRFYYEAPEPQLGSWPLHAVRTQRYKYIRTYELNDRDKIAYEELYDLDSDPHELTNVIDDEKYRSVVKELSRDMDSLRGKFNN
ncbi:N-acetylglucosamine-6-sulfatase [Fodinibius roseus]|uniref:N-acetylglucosamine-6-sulfatase n=1 Tax=Fodinibius roseus TaxID=1194090 RepID=A0A1M5EY33_9BACT|nr:N-acetylglucosamine-6-sulfatase [Fodinibius roseus]